MFDDDNKLIIETLNGKTESFGMLVEKYQNKMFNLAFQITFDHDNSMDIVQDSFLKAYNKLRTFDTGKKFFSWIYRITLNTSLNYKNHSKYTTSLSDEMIDNNHSTFEDLEKSETFQKIQIAISELDDNYKSLILLKHYQELSYKEISEILGLPISKVKSRLYSAREKLRISLVVLKNEKSIIDRVDK